MKTSTISKLAMLAKKRLNGAMKEKLNYGTNNVVTCEKIYQNLYKNNYRIISLKQNDDVLYSKICRLLDENYDNPFILQNLVEYDIYNKLEDNKKMEYILRLSDKYLKLKERYDREHFDNREVV